MKDVFIMPKEKEITKIIPNIYKRKYEDLGMFFFVEGQKSIVPTIKITQAIRKYFEFIGEQENEDIECAMVTFSRMRAEFIDLKYETSQKNK